MTAPDPQTPVPASGPARLDPARRRRFAVAAMLLPVAAVVVIEVALRVAGFEWPLASPPLRFFNQQGCEDHGLDSMMVPDPALFWRLRPGWRMRAGSDAVAPTGFRSAFATQKTPGVRRIVCVGDSNTYGLFVPLESAWPSVLARRLAAGQGAAKSEVLNLGVPGYTSFQVRRLLDTDVGKLAPDVVVAEVGGFNEWIPAVQGTDREQGRRAFWRDLRIVQFLAGALGLRGSAAGRSASDSAGDDAARDEIAGLERQVKVRDSAGSSELRTADYRGTRRVPIADFEDDLRAISEWGADHGARVVLVVHPLPARTLANNPAAAEYDDAVRRCAAARGLPVVDGPAALRASGRTDAESFVDLCHPSASGHAALAGAVHAAVTR